MFMAVPLQPDWIVAYQWSWRACTRFHRNSAPSLKSPPSNHWHYCSVLPRESFHCRSAHRPNDRPEQSDPGRYASISLSRTSGCSASVTCSLLHASPTTVPAVLCDSNTGASAVPAYKGQASSNKPPWSIDKSIDAKLLSASWKARRSRSSLIRTGNCKRIFSPTISVPALLKGSCVPIPNNWRLKHSVRRHIWSWNQPGDWQRQYPDKD